MSIVYYRLKWIMGNLLFETEYSREMFKERNKEMLSDYDLEESNVGY